MTGIVLNLNGWSEGIPVAESLRGWRDRLVEAGWTVEQADTYFITPAYYVALPGLAPDLISDVDALVVPDYSLYP